jgi:hypothetical protein
MIFLSVLHCCDKVPDIQILNKKDLFGFTVFILWSALSIISRPVVRQNIMAESCTGENWSLHGSQEREGLGRRKAKENYTAPKSTLPVLFHLGNTSKSFQNFPDYYCLLGTRACGSHFIFKP